MFAALISRVANSEDVCGSGASDATAWTLVLSEDGSNCLDVSMSGVPRTEDEVTSPEWCETVDRPIIAYKRITNTNAQIRTIVLLQSEQLDVDDEFSPSLKIGFTNDEPTDQNIETVKEEINWHLVNTEGLLSYIFDLKDSPL